MLFCQKWAYSIMFSPLTATRDSCAPRWTTLAPQPNAAKLPVGAVVVINDEIVARAGNRTIADCDPTAHAEVIALRKLKAYRKLSPGRRSPLRHHRTLRHVRRRHDPSAHRAANLWRAGRQRRRSTLLLRGPRSSAVESSRRSNRRRLGRRRSGRAKGFFAARR